MIATTSRPLYLYLQRPDTGDWVTVGRYTPDVEHGAGRFAYAPSYADAGRSWSIDPVNLPFRALLEVPAPRYQGLHDVLRDACPDAWGQALLRREYGLPEDTPAARYLMLAGNGERWGALAVGTGRKPSNVALATPALPLLGALVQELAAMSAAQPPIDARLRRRLVQTASVGGARPKATVRDPQGRFWLVKPRVPADVADIPALEHMTQQWGVHSGLNFAATVLHAAGSAHSAVRVLRFDRHGQHRQMCVSAASLLQAEYPGARTTDRWSYPRLSEELRRIGAPPEDRRELFGRMIFNAVCGNDDDHVRNHAVAYVHEERRWRLTPAFDVVPNPVETPVRLAMQLSTGRFDISRDSALADAHRFGFDDADQASAWFDALLDRIAQGFEEVVAVLEPAWQAMMRARLGQSLRLLSRT